MHNKAPKNALIRRKYGIKMTSNLSWRRNYVADNKYSGKVGLFEVWVGEIGSYLGGAARHRACSHGRPHTLFSRLAFANLSPTIDPCLGGAARGAYSHGGSQTLLSGPTLTNLSHDGSWVGEMSPYLGGAARRRACNHGGPYTLFSQPQFSAIVSMSSRQNHYTQGFPPFPHTKQPSYANQAEHYCFPENRI
uniref:Uncharacterized protein n=1 Tax=Tanacetum cinerariifolium TaxID=118510 RepID=A0A699GG59_TANCI|nr:hypothetical protein [Tanacetum cinerariifolium]